MSRTDVHSPKHLITEDYEFVGCGQFGRQGEPGYSPLTTPVGQALLADGWHFAENESAGDCYHCGARLTYFAILKHVPSHTLIRVGEQCLDNRFDRASSEFHALRKQSALDRKAQRIKARRVEWLSENDHLELYAWLRAQCEGERQGYDEFLVSLYNQIDRKGELSERQIEALRRSITRQAERDAKRAEQAENEPPAAPVVEGKVQVTGKVVSIKWHENGFGGKLVMTVLDDRGFKVWGTVPQAIVEGLDRLVDENRLETRAASYKDFVRDNEVRVRFIAAVEKSDRDETFGFFKRPTQGTVEVAS